MSSNTGSSNTTEAQRGRPRATAQNTQHPSGSRGQRESSEHSTRMASRTRPAGAMREGSRGPDTGEPLSSRPAEGQSPAAESQKPPGRLVSPARIVPGQGGGGSHGSPSPTASSRASSRSTGPGQRIETPADARGADTGSNRVSPAASASSRATQGSRHTDKSVKSGETNWSTPSGETFINGVIREAAGGGTSLAPHDYVLCIDGTGNDMVNEDEAKNTNVAKITDLITNGMQAHRMVTVAYLQGLGNDGFTYSMEVKSNKTERGWFQKMQAAFDQLTPPPSLIAKLVAINYTYISTRMRPSTDRLFLFGFSRGAYISQITAALVADLGLFDSEAYLSSEHLDETHLQIVRKIVENWIKFRGDRNEQGFKTEIGAYSHCFKSTPIEFLGHFDMVASVGLPDTAFFDSQCTKFRFAESIHNRPLILNAYHAVAISEHRKNFAPVVWKQGPANASQTASQVWFPGYHTSIGGGTKQKGIMVNHITLVWMLSKCAGLADVINQPELLKAITREASRAEPMKGHAITDSRKGIWAKPGLGHHFRQELGLSAIDKLHRLCEEQSWSKYCAPEMPNIHGTKEHPIHTNRLLQASLFDTPNPFECQFLQDIVEAGQAGRRSSSVSPPNRNGRARAIILDSRAPAL